MSNIKTPKDFLSNTAKNIPPSGIRKFFDIVNEMEDAISLGVGEPDFVTPWHIRNAGIESMKDGHTYYTSNWGLIELREEIAKFYDRKYGIKYNPKNEVFVTVGGSEAVDATIRALIEKGDEVLIPEPSFVCYKPCVDLAGGTAVPIITTEEDNFKLVPENLISKITDKTKLLIISYPNNPTGAIMTKEQIEEKYGDVVDCVFSNAYFLEVMPKNVSKGSALEFLCTYTGIPGKNSYAFADAENDISMLHAAGHGVALLNAHKEAKESADFITFTDNNHDGLAIFLNRLAGIC